MRKKHENIQRGGLEIPPLPIMALMAPQALPVLSTTIIGGGYHPCGFIVASFKFKDIT